MRTLLCAALFIAGCQKPATTRVPFPHGQTETIRIPTLDGLEVEVPVSKIGKIKPFGWAMKLDQDDSPRTMQLFEVACKANPELSKQVDELLATKAMIDARTRGRRGLFRSR